MDIDLEMTDPAREVLDLARDCCHLLDLLKDINRRCDEQDEKCDELDERLRSALWQWSEPARARLYPMLEERIKQLEDGKEWWHSIKRTD